MSKGNFSGAYYTWVRIIIGKYQKHMQYYLGVGCGRLGEWDSWGVGGGGGTYNTH